MPAADLAEWEAFDRVVGLPDPNAYQAHLCQYLSGSKRSKLEDFLLVPVQSRRPDDRLTADESAAIFATNAPSLMRGR